ncbi:MAG: hypothetical protein KAX33_04240 [Candidatus Lokiarchaeota archaeon]|nr:hypothetical protein [Candidatus Lokiarchaeota archaeon]MCK4282255.1 hypothetical protein [Candidatus Lokiarchaeota archaeon]
MENNISKKIKLILSKIKNINSQYSDFFTSLDELVIPSKDSLIEDIYNNILLKNDFFSEFTQISNKTIMKLEKDQLFERIISQIKSNPDKKTIYIQQFLDSFEDISPQDKKVMIQSFLKLNEQSLRDQMTSLMSIFKFKA